jgi:PadR family transcriptional regulator PadR
VIKLKDKSQLLKGTLEGCILKVIGDSQTYGYEISEKLKLTGLSEISEGTVYPLLLRLEKNDLVNTELKDSPFGPKRKYYTLSEKGREELSDFFTNWKQLKHSIDYLFKDYESGDKNG